MDQEGSVCVVNNVQVDNSSYYRTEQNIFY